MEIEFDNVKTIELPEISEKLIGKKVKIKGMVSKITDILSEKYQTTYVCSNCGNIVNTKKNKKPYYCYVCKTEGNYKLSEEHFRDFREMEIEETLENIDRQPQRIKVRLLGDILDRIDIKKIQIGQIVEIIAVVDKEKTRVKNDREIYSYFLMCSVINVLDYSPEIDSEINELDREEFDKIRKNNPLDLLSKSLAPNIYGYESIKKAIILQMVRGPESLKNIRPRIHILVVSDPSLGKSKLAWEVHQKMPKSIYGSGDNMSAAGLSSSVEKDELTGHWIARAGILCRTNKSMVVIDEIEKLKSDDKKALHTPMEQGIIVVDKAGLHIQMSADCSILACCNPKKGYFDTSGYNSVSEEVKLPEAIISRFDLIYYMRDIVDSEKDKKIIKSFFNKENEDILENNLFKKYISYASKIEPIVSDEVQETLEELYNKLRGGSKGQTESRITARQAGGLLRLAVASAKIRMSEIVELSDLKIAEDLMLDALESIGFARNLNALDQTSIYTNTTKKKMNVQTQLIELIKDLILSGNNTEKGLEEVILSRGFAVDLYKRVFDGLKREGSIIGTYNDLKWIN